MGTVVAFPTWRVLCRAEGDGRGEPRALLDPGGRRHDIEQVLRRRLVASRDPRAPILHEFEVRTAGGCFRLRWTEPGADWTVEPLD